MDGHYSLDLSNQMDKFCLNKLLELGMTIAFRRAKKRYACATVWLCMLYCCLPTMERGYCLVRRSENSSPHTACISLICCYVYGCSHPYLNAH
jgi:hypothetical protein